MPEGDVDDLTVVAKSGLPSGGGVQKYSPPSCPVGMNVFPYAEEGVDAMRAQGNRFVWHALAEGTVRHSEGEA